MIFFILMYSFVLLKVVGNDIMFVKNSDEVSQNFYTTCIGEHVHGYYCPNDVCYSRLYSFFSSSQLRHTNQSEQKRNEFAFQTKQKRKKNDII